MPSKTLRNATDSFVAQSQPSKNFGRAARFHVRNEAGNQRKSLIFFNMPFPKGSRILSAKLRVWNALDISGALNLTVSRAASKWSANTIKWNNFPGGAGVVGSTSKTDANAGTMFEVDVTGLVQDISNGAAWYGFILTTSTANKTGVFRSTQAASGTTRPTLIITWSEAPHQPSALSPAGGRKVPTQKPTLTYDFSDPNGDGDLAKSQFQIFTANNAIGTYLEFQTGWINTDLPVVDLAATAYAGIPADGSSRWWRVQAQDEDGNLSPWSELAEMKYAAKGVVAVTAPGGTFSDGSPLVSWTLSGGPTQKSYQVWIALASSPGKWLWTSGKITDSIQSLNIPFGVITNPSSLYRIGVRVWDTQDREAIPGNPAYSEAYVDATYAAGATSDVTSLAASADPVKPNITLTWSRTAAPDTFQILVSKDGGTSWTYLDEVTAAEVSIGGTNYRWINYGVAWYKQMTYKVISIVGSVGGAGAQVNAKATKLAPFLMRPDGTDLVCFLNPDRSRQRMDIQEVHQTMDGAQILVTQALGKFAGHVKGGFYDGFPTGYTGEQMRDSFESMRKDSGTPLRLSYADQTLKVVAYNMTVDSFADANGVYYLAEFDWIQVP